MARFCLLVFRFFRSGARSMAWTGTREGERAAQMRIEASNCACDNRRGRGKQVQITGCGSRTSFFPQTTEGARTTFISYTEGVMSLGLLAMVAPSMHVSTLLTHPASPHIITKLMMNE
jgi:hypothetical protein